MTRTTQRMQRTTVGIIALAALLAGCATADEPGAESESPMPTATSEPTTEAPEPPAEPSPAPSSEPPQCGDAYVLFLTSARSGFSTFPGTDEEILAAAQPRAGFIAPEALDGLEVLCTVTYLAPTDGGPGIVEVSSAFVAPGPEVESQLAAWATANGYLPDDTSTPYAERSQPRLDDGDSTRKIVFGPLSRISGPNAPTLEEMTQQTGAALAGDTLFVTRSDITIPQG